jgi:hypothetical protein
MLQFISPEVARLLKLTSATIILQNSFTFSSSEVDPHVEITTTTAKCTGDYY